MKTSQNWRIMAFALLSAALGATFLGGAAHAITDTVFKYSTAKTGYLQITTASLALQDSSKGYSRNALAISPATSTLTCFLAPVSLPQGAKMTALAIWYVRAGSSFPVALTRQKMSDATATNIIVKALGNTSLARKGVSYSITGAAQIIDNLRYNYEFEVCMNATNDVFYGARISFTYGDAGD